MKKGGIYLASAVVKIHTKSILYVSKTKEKVMLNIHTEILSFTDVAQIAGNSEKSVLLIRHSYRESLQNGNLDPELTSEGWKYAVECGTFLKGMKEICFGASPRKRTFQTVEAIIKGGELGEENTIKPYPCLHDTAMFSPPEGLALSLENRQSPNDDRLERFCRKSCIFSYHNRI